MWSILRKSQDDLWPQQWSEHSTPAYKCFNREGLVEDHIPPLEEYDLGDGQMRKGRGVDEEEMRIR